MVKEPIQEDEVGCSSSVARALEALTATWDAVRAEPSPFGNTGARFDGKAFSAHAYSWNDEPQEFNFAWRDVRVRWYKYQGRSMTMNRRMADAEVRVMLRECLQELLADAQAAAG